VARADRWPEASFHVADLGIGVRRSRRWGTGGCVAKPEKQKEAPKKKKAWTYPVTIPARRLSFFCPIHSP
jgi:hypothetical protein